MPLSAKMWKRQPDPSGIGLSTVTEARPDDISQPPPTAFSPDRQSAVSLAVAPWESTLNDCVRYEKRLADSELVGPGVAAICAAVWPFSVAASVAGPGVAAIAPRSGPAASVRSWRPSPCRP